MKGLIFVEFMNMVEEKFSPEVLEKIIDDAALPSGCAYTTLGTYNHQELVQLVLHLSATTQVPVSELLKTFGSTIFRQLARKNPHFFVGVVDSFEFIERVDGYVHMEVRKLYPDAELPSFQCERVSDTELRLLYKSVRHLEDLALGMLVACGEHFGQPLSVRFEPVVPDGDVPACLFTICKT